MLLWTVLAFEIMTYLRSSYDSWLCWWVCFLSCDVAVYFSCVRVKPQSKGVYPIFTVVPELPCRVVFAQTSCLCYVISVLIRLLEQMKTQQHRSLVLTTVGFYNGWVMVACHFHIFIRWLVDLSTQFVRCVAHHAAVSLASSAVD